MKLWRINYMQHMKNGEVYIRSLSVMANTIMTALTTAKDILINKGDLDIQKISINQIEAVEHEDIFNQLKHRQDICSLLLRTLREAYGQEDLVTINYICSYGHDDEYVLLKWKNGSTRRIDVSADSDIAMIRDIMKTIE